MKIKNLIYLSIFSLSAQGASAVTITTLGPDVYDSNTSAMDAVLGIDGSYVVEDFEDFSLVSNLSISYESVGAGLPFDFRTLSDAQWDGSRYFLAVSGSQYSGFNTNPTFAFSDGLSSVGLGLSGFQFVSFNWTILVNGIDLGVSPLDYFSPTNDRNGYLWLNADAGETIHRVSFVSNRGGDSFGVDHLAFKVAAQVPEPSALGLMALGLGGVLTSRRGISPILTFFAPPLVFCPPTTSRQAT